MKTDGEEATQKRRGRRKRNKEIENLATLIIDGSIPVETVFSESWPTTISVWLRI